MKKFLFCLSFVTIVSFSSLSVGYSANHYIPPNNKTTDMDHSNATDNRFKEAENPSFKVGSQAIINADHMKGMKGAIATIVGAYDTIAYVVSYTPTTGGEKVKNHRWVVQEEIENAGNIPLRSGTKVSLEADHMKGMKGATATIESGEKATVYMIDYTPTTGGKRVKNHKWVTESELETIENP